jgi:hypothetical protein
MDLFSVLIVAVVCVGIGFVIATLLSNLREEQPQVNPEETAEVVDRVQVLRLWRHEETGALLPEVKGEVLESAKGLDAEQHAAVSIALVDLYSWMEAGNQAVPKLVVETEPESPARHPRTRGDMVSSEAESPTGPEEVKPASMNIFKSLVRTAQKEATQKVEAETPSIAAQVDEILQEKLSASPLAGQGIRLMDLPGQGMVIMVGLDKYPDIASVPDEDIKKLLRASVSEWEAGTKREAKEE